MSLTPEDRSLLAAAYRRMIADAEKCNEDARAGLADPFWQLYAECFLGGYERVQAALASRAAA